MIGCNSTDEELEEFIGTYEQGLSNMKTSVEILIEEKRAKYNNQAIQEALKQLLAEVKIL